MQVNASSERKGLDVTAIQRQLKTRTFGITVDSTNSLALKLAWEQPEEGVVVLTDSQTAGKGRLGRRCVDMYGCNVLSSTLLRPLFPPHFLVMIASLAIVDAIAETCGVSATIKWPNDVLVGKRKVAGILIETSHVLRGTVERGHSSQLVAILGIGVNVNGNIQDIAVGSSPMISQSLERHSPDHQGSLSAVATTLETECGREVSRETFITHLLQHIEADYLTLQHEAREPFFAANGCSPASHAIWERWRSQLTTLGRTIQVRQGDIVLSGVAEEVNENGELLLRLHSGELVTITWGDVGYPTG